MSKGVEVNMTTEEAKAKLGPGVVDGGDYLKLVCPGDSRHCVIVSLTNGLVTGISTQ
ncbi:hypothetical protein H4R19_001980 [Coemansia spiralis]|nr:hypothetical protein H4R19_001980 [Coemansia spiralis]